MKVAAGKVGSSNAVAKQSITGDELLLGRNKQTDAARSVAGSVKNVKLGLREPDNIAIACRDVDARIAWFGNSQPRCLHGQAAAQKAIVLIHVHRRASARLQFLGAADVIDVSVGDHDRGDAKFVTVKNALDVGKIIPGIYHDGFTGGLVAKDRAVALQRANRQDFVDHYYAS